MFLYDAVQTSKQKNMICRDLRARPKLSRPRPRPRPQLPRPRRDRDVCLHARDETETRPSIGLETVSRPRRRDRDHIPDQQPTYLYNSLSFPSHSVSTRSSDSLVLSIPYVRSAPLAGAVSETWFALGVQALNYIFVIREQYQTKPDIYTSM